jgi:rhodanese-related sulfurtransferase
MISRNIAILASLFLATAGFAGERFAAISHPELKQAIADHKVVLLDANGSETYQQGHIPGAIDFSTSAARLASLLPADKGALIVAYCGNEACGAYASAAEAARKLGYTNVRHYSPGIAGWKKSGEKIEKTS